MLHDQLAQPRARLLAQLGVEVRQRLVHQDHRRVVDQRARDRDALLLAAGELVRQPLAEVARAESWSSAVVHARCRSRRRRPCAASGRRPRCRTPSCAATARTTGTRGPRLRLSAGTSTPRGAVEDRPCRRSRIVPLVRRLEPRDRAQQRRLAAARGAQQRHHLARLQRHRHALEDRVVAVGEVQVVDGELGHAGLVHGSRAAHPKRSATREPDGRPARR